MAALQDEKNSLVSENEILNDRLEQLDDSLDDPNTAVAKKYFHAQLQLEQLQEENFRYETILFFFQKSLTCHVKYILRISDSLSRFSILISFAKIQ